MEKKENIGTKLNVLLCNLVDYVREDNRPLVFAVMQEITEYFNKELDRVEKRAREEVLLELLEKKTNYKIERVDHGYKVTQEYVLVSDIEKELSKLKSKQEWKRR